MTDTRDTSNDMPRPQLDPMNPQQVAYEIARLSGILEDATAQYALDIEEAAGKQARLKGAWARAMLTVISGSTGSRQTVAEREALVEVEINNERIIADIAEAKSKATREALRSLIAQIDALRSLGANLRVQT